MNSSIAAIHVAKKQLGLDEDTYRAKLQLIVGKSSVKEMTEDEREAVILKFREEGFVPKGAAPRAGGRKKLTGKYAGKLQALWIAGWNLGVIRDRDDSALIAFVKRQTGLDAVQFLRFPDDARKAIESIKSMLQRDGGVDWRADRFRSAYTQVDGYRIAKAQWKKLGKPGDVLRFAVEMTDHGFDALEDRSWIPVMNELGGCIRAQGERNA
jgi:hypothetical protein